VPLEFNDAEDENNNEESKYGATDRRNKVEVSNQDGAFPKSSRNAKKKKNTKMTAPAGKFKCFRAEINKNALTDMNKDFWKEFTKKNSTESFFQGGKSKQSTNMQPTANPFAATATKTFVPA